MSAEIKIDVVEKGTLVLYEKEVHGVKISPGRHDVFHTRHDHAHPGECHDFGISNYIVMRILRGHPYPLDIFVCRRQGCVAIVVQDPLSRDEIGGVFRRPPSRKI